MAAGSVASQRRVAAAELKGLERQWGEGGYGAEGRCGSCGWGIRRKKGGSRGSRACDREKKVGCDCCGFAMVMTVGRGRRQRVAAAGCAGRKTKID